MGYELNYSPIERVCLSIMFSTKNLRHYILNRKVKLISKVDPLKYSLLAKAAITSQIAKWVMILSEFYMVYVDRRAIKRQIIADQLAEAPIDDHKPLIVDFPDESILMKK